MKAHFVRFAGYNAWANGHLYDAAAALSAAELWEDRGAFFGSVMGTLNHLLVGDRIWMRRFGAPSEAPKPASLDEILFEDLAALRAAREAEDRRISAFVGTLDAAWLENDLSYVDSQGLDRVAPASVTLSHFFNHQTHHRGQAHALITGLGHPVPQLDLIYYAYETQT